MKIYTKKGDGGSTGLFGGGRVSKSSVRVDAYGEVDELNSVIGWARQHPIDDGVDALLSSIQSMLLNLGAELSSTPGREVNLGSLPRVSDVDIESIERAIDASEAELPQLTAFVLPGGSPGAAALHLARTVCRRAERRVVTLAAAQDVRPEIVRYLNRLSDLFFSLARLANHRVGVPDAEWRGRD